MPSLSKFLLASLSALTIFFPVLEAGKTLTLDLTEEKRQAPHGLRRRQSGDGWRTTDIVYNSTEFAFYVDVNIGDNSKKFKLEVIQNPYTFVARKWNRTTNCGPETNSYDDACAIGEYSGLFTFSDSTTYENLTEEFYTSYTDDRYAEGIWGRDSFQLGQLTVNNINFGVVDSYNATPALGLEQSSSLTKFPTFLEVMQSENIINTVTYGIYIGDVRSRADTGKSITFGGIDEAKFEKPLKTYDSVSGYDVNLLTIRVIYNGEVAETPLDVPESQAELAELNFGTSSIHVTQDVHDSIMAILGADQASNDNYYLRDLPPEDAGLEFVFEGNLTIKIPARQFVTESNSYEGWWLVLIVPNTSFLFGTPFFRAAYVFYDFQNTQISLGAANYNVTASNVTEVGVNNASVTSLEWLYVDPSPVATLPPTTTSGGPSDTITPEPKETGSGGGKSVNAGAIAGGVVGGVALLAIGGLLLWWFKFRNKEKEPMMPPDTMQQTPMTDNGKGPGVFTGQRPVHTPQGFSNEQFSPTKPNFPPPNFPPPTPNNAFSPPPFTSPISELDPSSPSGHSRFENVAPQRPPPAMNVHELA